MGGAEKRRARLSLTPLTNSLAEARRAECNRLVDGAIACWLWRATLPNGLWERERTCPGAIGSLGRLARRLLCVAWGAGGGGSVDGRG